MVMEHVKIGIIFYCIGNSKWWVYNTQLKSDWLFNTQSRVLQVDWLIFENDENPTLTLTCPIDTKILMIFFISVDDSRILDPLNLKSYPMRVVIHVFASIQF